MAPSVAGVVALGVLAVPEWTDAQEVRLATAEPTVIVTIINDFRACVDGAVAVTRPSVAPNIDDATRNLVFDTMVESCDAIRDAQIAGLNARQKSATLDAEMEARTDAIINGAKAELGIKS